MGGVCILGLMAGSGHTMVALLVVHLKIDVFLDYLIPSTSNVHSKELLYAALLFDLYNSHFSEKKQAFLMFKIACKSVTWFSCEGGRNIDSFHQRLREKDSWRLHR